MQRVYRLRQASLGNIGWLGRIGIFAGVALLVALVVAFAIVLVPIVGLALLFARWRVGRLRREMAAARPAEPPADPRIIDGEYVVIEHARNGDGH